VQLFRHSALIKPQSNLLRHAISAERNEEAESRRNLPSAPASSIQRRLAQCPSRSLLHFALLMICTRYRSETDKWTDSPLSPYLACGRARDNGVVQRSLISASRRKGFLSREARSVSLFFFWLTGLIQTTKIQTKHANQKPCPTDDHCRPPRNTENR